MRIEQFLVVLLDIKPKKDCHALCSVIVGNWDRIKSWKINLFKNMIIAESTGHDWITEGCYRNQGEEEGINRTQINLMKSPKFRSHVSNFDHNLKKTRYRSSSLKKDQIQTNKKGFFWNCLLPKSKSKKRSLLKSSHLRGSIQ